MLCRWGLTRQKQLSMIASYLLGWHGCVRTAMARLHHRTSVKWVHIASSLFSTKLNANSVLMLDYTNYRSNFKRNFFDIRIRIRVCIGCFLGLELVFLPLRKQELAGHFMTFQLSEHAQAMSLNPVEDTWWPAKCEDHFFNPSLNHNSENTDFIHVSVHLVRTYD